MVDQPQSSKASRPGNIGAIPLPAFLRHTDRGDAAAAAD
jgi:hypothetical protein